MLKLNSSKDGIQRVTIPVSFRLTKEDMAKIVADKYYDPSDFPTSKKALFQILTNYVSSNGMEFYSIGCEDDSVQEFWDVLIGLALNRVEELMAVKK